MDLENEICPLCGSDRAKRGQSGIYAFAGVEYSYAKCAICLSMHLSPMPSAEIMKMKFGEDYQRFHNQGVAHCGDSQVGQVLRVMEGIEPGVFFDFGCGSGALLEEVAKLGWKAAGYDFSEPTAARSRRNTDLEIVSDLDELPAGFETDILNFGDVLTHLTELNDQFAEALKLVKNGGLVLAEGTLEANRNLFYLSVHSAQKLRPRRSETLPYDVILATSGGQRTFFERYGLRELQFEAFEANHPAPERLVLSDLKNPRPVLLFILRAISKTFTRLNRNKLGNRFFYVGVKEH